ncbi:MAG: hypothetical protein H7Z75_09010 [Ferruginibacter sp.]|nr:hypothetical protein [Cytophagales bacterium]
MRTKKWLVALLFTVASGWAPIQALPSPGNPPRTKSNTLEEEIARHLSDVALPKQFKGGVVVISFTVDEWHRLRNLIVHTADASLNTCLAARLAGSAISAVDFKREKGKPYLMKLRIRVV